MNALQKLPTRPDPTVHGADRSAARQVSDMTSHFTSSTQINHIFCYGDTGNSIVLISGPVHVCRAMRIADKMERKVISSRPRVNSSIISLFMSAVMTTMMCIGQA